MRNKLGQFIKGCQIRRTHGEAIWPYTSEYRSWIKMKRRCFDVRSNRYHCYGGRGITVCARWMKYENFLKDMGRKPNSSYTIDRINNDGNYEPSNCRWATDAEQRKNRRYHGDNWAQCK